MNRLLCLLAFILPAGAFAAAPAVIAKDLKDPTAVCVTPEGRAFVASSAGVSEVKDGKAEAFAVVKDPVAIVPFQRWLFTASADGTVHRIDQFTKSADVWVTAKDMPQPAAAVSAIGVDERGTLYLADAGEKAEAAGIVRVGVRFGPRGPSRGAVEKVVDAKGLATVGSPRGLVCEGLNHLLVLGTAGGLVRVNVANGTAEPLAEKLGTGAGLCLDHHGRLFALGGGTVWGIPRPGEKPVKVAEVGEGTRGLAFDPVGRRLVATAPAKGTVLATPAQIPGWEVNELPLIVETELAFADVKWTGWDDGSESGKVVPFRPIVLTHTGDGSGRTFVATQHGVIHVVEKGAKESKVFLDIQDKCLYRDNENEQGLLGLAFHPDYKKNGEFYVFYTDKSKRLENVLCRFKVSKDDPNKADPASEQELLRVSHKYWNHDGGTVAFGPDGYLYLVLGDGGSANDPDDHGQKTDVLLGKILRLDVNAKGETTAYAIPKDNPFVGKEGYRPEIFALGVRNPWRLSFDRKTGQGWFGEVGQNLWEEINLLEKGANYGWRRRESLHPFGADGTGPQPEFTDPIWEYHHDVGKSITGGHVYRGRAVGELTGYYLYADYVSGKLWGLKYDEKAKRVTANRPIMSKNLPIMSFGEDEAGEVYLMTYSPTGKGIYKFRAGR